MGQRLNADATQLRHLLCNARQLGRTIAALALACGALLGGGVEPMRRNIGGIGFHHQSRQRQAGRQLTQFERSVIGDSPAKTQLEAQIDKCLRLLSAAVEGVGNAAHHLVLAQGLEQAVAALAHMQDDGQLELLRQPDLLLVKPDLALSIESGHKKVEPDLAHRHQMRIAFLLHQQFAQRRNIGRLRARRVERMEAQRIAVTVSMGQRNYLLPVRALHSRNHQMLHTGGMCRDSNRLAIHIELGCIQVAMGIYPDWHLHIMHRLANWQLKRPGNKSASTYNQNPHSSYKKTN